MPGRRLLRRALLRLSLLRLRSRRLRRRLLASVRRVCRAAADALMDDGDQQPGTPHSWPADKAPCELNDRVGHVAAAAPDGRILVWGGYREDSADPKRYWPSDQVMVYHPLTSRFEEKRTSPAPGEHGPPFTSGATACVLGGHLFVMCGFIRYSVQIQQQQEDGEVGEVEVDVEDNTRDIYSLDLATWRWRKRKAAAGVPPMLCDKLASWTHGDKIYLFGGYGPECERGNEQQSKFIRDSHQSFYGNRGWNNQLVCYDPTSETFDWPLCCGDYPPPRAAHAVTASIPDSSGGAGGIFLFGGRLEGERMDDLYYFDHSEMRWTRLACSRLNKPNGRSWHSLTAVSPSLAVLYGGYDSDMQPLGDCWALELEEPRKRDRPRWRRCQHLELPGQKGRRLWHQAVLEGVTGQVWAIGGIIDDILAPTMAPVRHPEAMARLTFTPLPLVHLALRASLSAQKSGQVDAEEMSRIPPCLKALIPLCGGPPSIMVMELLSWALPRPPSLSPQQRAAALGILVLAVLWSLLGGPLQIVIFLVGAVAAAVAGASGYLLIRLHFSPRFSSPALPPKSALEFQESILESMESKKIPEEPTAPHITRNIDQSINDLIDLVTRDYVLHWIRDLMVSDEGTRAIIRRDVWVFVNNFSSRLAKVDMVKLLANGVVRKVADHFEKIRIVLQLQQSSGGGGNGGGGSEGEGGGSNGTNGGAAEDTSPKFPISPHLVSKEREVEYLGKVAEVLIVILCKEDYANCKPIRHLLREVLSRHVLSPAVELVTDPEYINSKVLAYIRKKQSRGELGGAAAAAGGGGGRRRASFVYADSFEDFVDLIGGCADVDELRQIRYNILTEVMQATTMDNLRKAKTPDANPSHAIGEEEESKKSGKGSVKKESTDMTKYIEQLLHAKNLCERRLAELGCDVNASSSGNAHYEDEDRAADSNNSGIGRSDLSFRSVMGSSLARRHFRSYLEEEEGQQDLLTFWEAVQELKGAERTRWHHLATEIFYAFINKTDISVQVDKPSLKRIEAFLLGDSGPEVFFELQGRVQEVLRETYFPSFLLSKYCSAMLREVRLNGGTLSGEPSPIEEKALSQEQPKETHDSEEEEEIVVDEGPDPPTQSAAALCKKVSSDVFSGLSGMAKNHLVHVSERLQNKVQAMSALKSSLKPDSRILTMLQQEVETLGEEKKAVESHIHRTESWADNLGAWQCQVQSLEYSDGGASSSSSSSGGGGGSGGGSGESFLKAVLLVYVPEEGFSNASEKDSAAALASSSNSPSSPSGGNGGSPKTWTCVRRISDFHNLHRDLVPFVGWVKGVDLPSQSRSVFLRTPNSRAALERARQMLQRFMDSALEDDLVNRSELLYGFLACPHPGYLKAYQSVTAAAASSSSSPRKGTSTAFPSLAGFFKEPASLSMSGSGSSASASSSSSASQPPSLMTSSSGTDGATSSKSSAPNPGGGGNQDDFRDEDGRLWFDEFDVAVRGGQDGEQPQKDVIAESLYRLVGEVFDMRGVFRLLRKSLMTFVQLTYGGSINRQIRDAVAWLTSEQMILWYLGSFRKAYWHPNGQFREYPPPPDPESEQAKEKRAALAAETRTALADSLPDALVSLVGQQAAAGGAVKVFEALQNVTLNKQLLYEVLEMGLVEIFPEIASQQQQQHQPST